MSVVLRPYQQDLIDRVRDELRAGRKSVLLQAPTGSGKTVMFSYIAKSAIEKNKRVGIFVHRDELVQQVSRTLSDFDVRHGVIAANSIMRTGPRVHVCSVQTYVRRIGRVPTFDLIIADEAHHCVLGSMWNKSFEASPGAVRLGVTATPERLSGEGLGGTFETMVQGPSVAELIQLGALSPYRLFAPERADTSGLHSRGGDFARDETAALMDRPTITGSAVQHYRQRCDGYPAVAFCVSVAHAQHVAEQFRSQGYRAACVDGSMDRDTRRQIMADFAGGRLNVLASCDLISEGYDCPGIFAAFLLRPTQSLGLYLQQVGRALRPFPGKRAALIFDHVGNWDRHGLPDDDRKWSLAGRERKRKSATDVEVIRNRRCPHCLEVSPATYTHCQGCKKPFPITGRTVEEVSGTLGEIDPLTARRQKNIEQASARSVEALEQLGRMRGMSNPAGWARHVWQARQEKRG